MATKPTLVKTHSNVKSSPKSTIKRTPSKMTPLKNKKKQPQTPSRLIKELEIDCVQQNVAVIGKRKCHQKARKNINNQMTEDRYTSSQVPKHNQAIIEEVNSKRSSYVNARKQITDQTRFMKYSIVPNEFYENVITEDVQPRSHQEPVYDEQATLTPSKQKFVEETPKHTPKSQKNASNQHKESERPNQRQERPTRNVEFQLGYFMDQQIEFLNNKKVARCDIIVFNKKPVRFYCVSDCVDPTTAIDFEFSIFVNGSQLNSNF
uniref:Uncharacterized protein n=1 Tax=Clytia hemisphaerica TaxID=252671 RepID=A0A7M5V6I9_9CNID